MHGDEGGVGGGTETVMVNMRLGQAMAAALGRSSSPLSSFCSLAETSVPTYTGFPSASFS